MSSSITKLLGFGRKQTSPLMIDAIMGIVQTKPGATTKEICDDVARQVRHEKGANHVRQQTANLLWTFERDGDIARVDGRWWPADGA